MKINFDVEKIAEQFKEFAREVEADLVKSVAILAQQTKAKVERMASGQDETIPRMKLNSSLEGFLKSVHYDDLGEGIHIVSISEESLWIEEGIEPGKDMKPDLLKKGTQSESGTRYRVIPFDQGSKPSTMTPYAQDVVAQIRSNLKSRGVPFKKIEFNKDGSPRVGKLHSFNFGGDIPGKGNTPIMDRVSIYQSQNQQTGKVRRDIMTFRTVSNGPGSEGKWIHPGFEAKKYLDKAADWAVKEWEDNILPEIIGKWERVTK